MPSAELESALKQAALAHYSDFGHSLIYVTKAVYLIDTLGSSVAEPLLLSLVRSLIFASREDQIPEFRAYQPALQAGMRPSDSEVVGRSQPLRSADLHHLGVAKSVNRLLASSACESESLYRPLLMSNAYNLLHFDVSQDERVRVSVSGNVNWLSFTHGVTFANAVRKQCRKFPDLWPQGLLQLACFNGRNAACSVST